MVKDSIKTENYIKNGNDNAIIMKIYKANDDENENGNQ